LNPPPNYPRKKQNPTFTHSTPNPTYTPQTKKSLIFPGRKTLIFSSRKLSSLIFKDSLLPEHSGIPKFFDKMAMTYGKIRLGSCKQLPAQLSHNFVSKSPRFRAIVNPPPTIAPSTGCLLWISSEWTSTPLVSGFTLVAHCWTSNSYIYIGRKENMWLLGM